MNLQKIRKSVYRRYKLLHPLRRATVMPEELLTAAEWAWLAVRGHAANRRWFRRPDSRLKRLIRDLVRIAKKDPDFFPELLRRVNR